MGIDQCGIHRCHAMNADGWSALLSQAPSLTRSGWNGIHYNSIKMRMVCTVCHTPCGCCRGRNVEVQTSLSRTEQDIATDASLGYVGCIGQGVKMGSEMCSVFLTCPSVVLCFLLYRTFVQHFVACAI
jgi:hypothetical protein